MREELRKAIARALHAGVGTTRPLGGGDINDAFEARLEDGRHVFVKTHPDAPRSMYPAEAKGLEWLGEAGALRVPKVLAVSEEDGSGPVFLVLEMISEAPRARDFDETLGRGLAELHRFGAPTFGLDHDNFIGSLPQHNAPCDTWPELYRSRRLEPQLDLAESRGRIGKDLRRRFDDLLDVLEDRVGPEEPPARLHGDLWGGNLHVGDDGEPCLIDPAVYGGHREVDLAMMQLFGGFGRRVFEAYDETWPLADGWQERIPLYQLYPLLVHVNLFGGPYVASVSRTLDRVL